MRHPERVSSLREYVWLLWLAGSLLAFPILSSAAAAPDKTSIQSESIEYEKETGSYTAKGAVVIHRGEATVTADEVIYNEVSGEAVATGAVTYTDPGTIIRARRAELNLEFKTGILYDAEVLIRKDNSRIAGKEIEKVAEDEYVLKEASFTTCDAPVPAWCFMGKDVEVAVGDRLTARNVTFRVKGAPVLYLPYLSAPLGRERKTGLLLPSVGYIKSKGFHYEQPFFFAAADNRDATVTVDVYTNRGVGTGLEYRFIEPDLSRGSFWIYHIKDNDFERNFWDLRGVYENRDAGRNLAGFLKVNYINSREFYSEYFPSLLTRQGFLDAASFLSATTERFLESAGEAAYRFDGSSIYLTGRYLVDLKIGVPSGTVLKKLPEIGYVLDPQPVGPVVFSLLSSAANFSRDEGARGQRIDIYPRVSYAVGSDITFLQALGLRETAYSLSRQGALEGSPHREALDYTAVLHTRLMRQYGATTHILEPSLGVMYIPSAGPELPSFDSVELYKRTAAAMVSLQNRLRDGSGEFLNIRFTQSYDAYAEDRRLLPLKIEAAVRRPVTLRTEVTFDYDKGRVEAVNSDVGFRFPDGAVSVGERYIKQDKILTFAVSATYNVSRALLAEGGFWLDARNGGLKDFIVKMKYQKQCWGMSAVVTKRQSDYSFALLFDLLGIGTVRF